MTSRCEKCIHFAVCKKRDESRNEQCDWEVPVNIGADLFFDVGMYSNLDSRFDVIKESARSKIALPSDFKADRIDRDYYVSMLGLFEQHRAKTISHEAAMEEGRRYRNKYVSDKAVNINYMKACCDAHQRRMKTGQITAKLIKNKLHFKKIIELIFELLTACLDEVTVKMIQRNIYLILATGKRNYTDDEIKKIKELRKDD